MSNLRQAPISPELLKGRPSVGPIEKALSAYVTRHGFPEIDSDHWPYYSAVLFLIGLCRTGAGASEEPCLILNKRSNKVRQPGDLCFPGGGISISKDRLLAALLQLPKSPFTNWMKRLPDPAFQAAKGAHMALFLAVALREAWEEMRLNPLKIKLLGVLPEQSLVVFDRYIIPMVGWINHHESFRINWEVERIVRIPVRELLKDSNYGKFQPMVKGDARSKAQPLHDGEFPCFIHRDSKGRELLWGATFRMVMDYLKIVFGFHIAPIEHLPKVAGFLPSDYPVGMNGVSPLV